jgi:hypothetical protein
MYVEILPLRYDVAVQRILIFPLVVTFSDVELSSAIGGVAEMRIEFPGEQQPIVSYQRVFCEERSAHLAVPSDWRSVLWVLQRDVRQQIIADR